MTGRGWAAAIYPAGIPLPTPAHPDAGRAGQIVPAALGCGQSLYRVYYGSATFGMVYW